MIRYHEDLKQELCADAILECVDLASIEGVRFIASYYTVQ